MKNLEKAAIRAENSEVMEKYEKFERSLGEKGENEFIVDLIAYCSVPYTFLSKSARPKKNVRVRKNTKNLRGV